MAERIGILQDAAMLMNDRRGEVIEIAQQETGTTREWVLFNVDLALEYLRQTSKLADCFQETHPYEGVTLRRRPCGVILGFAPWNAPITLATRAIAGPLACGNTVLLKASELCPLTHTWVADILKAAGVPQGALNVIVNDAEQAPEIVEALISHPAVRRINFTGSTRIGRAIAVVAAHHLKPCLLELSGKGTMIVLADADLEAAAKAAVFGGYFNQGQICMSTERIIVEESVADQFIAALIRRVDAESPQGRLIGADAAARVRSILDDAVELGARLIRGGKVEGDRISAAVVDEVSPRMRLYSEEVFGPVLGIVRVRDRDEALTIANDTEYGLVASIFSADIAAATEMLWQIEVGVGHINGSTVFDNPALPYGGVKASGYGRFGGTSAIEEFTECHWVAVHDQPTGNT